MDDGSTDGSGGICDAYAKRDGRIRVFHQENNGLAAARNTGLDHARGDLIAMVDSDDVLLSEYYLQFLYEALKKNDAQVSLCRYKTFGEDALAPHIDVAPCDAVVVSGGSVFTKEDPHLDFFQKTVAFLKLYQKECFREVRYPKGLFLEDYAVAPALLFPCKRIAVIDVPMYGYRIRKSGILRATRGSRLYRDFMKAWAMRLDYFRRVGCKEGEEKTLFGKLRLQADYYVIALRDGSVSDLTDEEIPDFSSFEKDFGLPALRRRFRDIPPELLPEHLKSTMQSERQKMLEKIRRLRLELTDREPQARGISDQEYLVLLLTRLQHVYAAHFHTCRVSLEELTELALLMKRTGASDPDPAFLAMLKKLGLSELYQRVLPLCRKLLDEDEKEISLCDGDYALLFS